MGLYDNEYPYQIQVYDANRKLVETFDTKDWKADKFKQFKKRFLSSTNYKFIGSYNGFSTLDMKNYTTTRPITLDEL